MAFEGMFESQAPGMQRGPGERAQVLTLLRRGVPRQDAPGAIEGVTDEGMVNGTKVYPDLVRAARLQLRLDVRMSFQALQ